MNMNNLMAQAQKMQRDINAKKEELENNKLREIFEFREGLKQIGVTTDTAKISDSEVLKEIVDGSFTIYEEYTSSK